MTVESEEAGLTDLLIRWEELRERGQSIPVEELCAGHSELVSARHRIDGLKAMAPLIGPTVPGPMPTTTAALPRSRRPRGNQPPASRSTANFASMPRGDWARSSWPMART